LIEPLAVGFHAAHQGGARPGQTAVVFGAGCIGLMSMMAPKVYGLSRVYQIDVQPKRLGKALELGAAGVINSIESDPVDAVMNLTGGRGCGLVIDTSGVEAAIGQAARMLRKGGTLVMVGYSKTGMMNIPSGLLMDKEIHIETVFRYRHIYPMAIDAAASGKVKLKGVVTDIFDFNDIQNAMDKSVTDKANIVKSVVKIA